MDYSSQVTTPTPTAAAAAVAPATSEANQHNNQQQQRHDKDEDKPLVSPEAAEAVASFLRIVNGSIRGNGTLNPMSERTALKFLVSRKFDVHAASHLYQMHEITRLQEGLTNIDPKDPSLMNELNSAKFTIFKEREPKSGAAIALFTAKLHSPHKSASLTSKHQSSNQSPHHHQDLRKEIQSTTLKSIVHQLDSALEDMLTQQNGIVFIYNMHESDLSNFDFDLCHKILNLLKGAYPAKLKKVLIVSPPLWFRAPFHLLRLIVREKLRDRVWLLSISQLQEHVPACALTPELGGTYQHDHQAWIEECNNLYKTRFDDLCDANSALSLCKAFDGKSKRILTIDTAACNVVDSQDSTANNNSSGGEGNGNLVRSNSGPIPTSYDYDDEGMSLSQFVDMLKETGKVGLELEYDSLVRGERDGTFFVSGSTLNMKKNRYINVRCYDHTRVTLEPHDLPDGSPFDDPMDYINANYVDGYRQSKAYISTQGPIGTTFGDFWRMMWQTGSRVIAMVTLNVENDMLKCDKYWPSADEPELSAGIYTIQHIDQDTYEDFIITRLALTNTRSNMTRDVWHLQFISWPDFGTPLNATALLKYRENVLKKQLDAMEQTLGAAYPPIVVHCSAGVGRSGTFITIDICIQKLETTGLVDVRDVVEKLRRQRFLSIQTKGQYIFCYKSVLEYAASCGLLEGMDLNDLLEKL